MAADHRAAVDQHVEFSGALILDRVHLQDAAVHHVYVEDGPIAVMHAVGDESSGGLDFHQHGRVGIAAAASGVGIFHRRLAAVHEHHAVRAPVVGNREVACRERAAVDFQMRLAVLRVGAVGELVAPHRERAAPHREVAGVDADGRGGALLRRRRRLAVVARVHEPARELDLAAADFEVRLLLLLAVRREPAARADVVAVVDKERAAALAQDERALQHVEVAVALRRRVAVRGRDVACLEAARVVAERTALAVEDVRAGTCEVERAGAGLDERRGVLAHVARDPQLVRDVVDGGASGHVVREGAVDHPAVRPVVEERAAPHHDVAARAQGRVAAGFGDGVDDERAAVDGRGADVAVRRVEAHDAAAGRAAVDLDVRLARDARRHVREHAVPRRDRHRVGHRRTYRNCNRRQCHPTSDSHRRQTPHITLHSTLLLMVTFR